MTAKKICFEINYAMLIIDINLVTTLPNYEIYYLPMSEGTQSSNPQLERISLQLLPLSAKQQEADSSFYRNLMECMALAV